MSERDRELLDEQVAYYRARAAEYDATTTPPGDPFAEYGEATRAAVRAFRPEGRVLELAAGTGQWTGLLAEYATELTALDSSPEMLKRNRARVRDDRIRYRVGDAFDLPATREWDVVFFGFFLSHIPPSHFDAFWQGIDGCLAPGGRVCFVDEGGHDIWDEDWIDRDTGVVNRQLTDGRRYRAVKVLWAPEELASRLARIGWTATVAEIGPFYWGAAHK